ncbi:transposase [Cupriavidus sp. UYPR2.512]|uniref:IS701 family transposase n=1 Tax=Cupriavidus sp. UYPR2.512 TaxID=1080187 RepID=UPI00035F30AD|nr:transposase [Cupriavidus sp. UYPR2.512]
MPLTERTRFYLSEWIKILLIAVPFRSQASFVELLCGCMVSPEGWVTRAISAIDSKKHWTTYYKLLERGSLRTVRLARALLRLVIAVLPCDMLTLVLDDTLVMRCSEKAPGVAWRREHSGKTNRPRNVWAQCIVTLAVSVSGSSGIGMALPIVSRLVPQRGNTNKLKIALALVRAISGVTDKPIRVLFDSWFMRARLVLPLLRRNMHVIGQARIDTALFQLPVMPKRPGRGRPRTYGERLSKQAIEALPATELSLPIYGKEQRVRLRSIIAVVRFLKGKPMRAVWCQFYDEKRQCWTKARLMLASETELDAQTVVLLYARRWAIEPLFHNLKRWFGFNNLWQQTRTVLELWMQIRSCAWTLTQLLSLAIADAFPMDTIAPWRVGQPVTAGLVAQWLRREFTGLALGLAELAKCWKFRRPEPRQAPAATG